MTTPIFGLLNRQITGDDALLHYGKERLRLAGMGAELHPGHPGQVAAELEFAPPRGCVLHLPYRLDITEAAARDEIAAFAAAAANKNCHGMVVHDKTHMFAPPIDLASAAGALSRKLGKIKQAPPVFWEYTCGAPFADFLAAAAKICQKPGLGVCLDIGHLAIAALTRLYAKKTGNDIGAWQRGGADFAAVVGQIDQLMRPALEKVLRFIDDFNQLRQGAPAHYHLHDAHPLSNDSIYGVADHLSFFWQITLPAMVAGAATRPGVFGPKGLGAALQRALAGAGATTLTLEVHNQPGRRPLSPAHAHFFAHWQDLRHAENMVYWQDLLLQNSTLLKAYLAAETAG